MPAECSINRFQPRIYRISSWGRSEQYQFHRNFGIVHFDASGRNACLFEYWFCCGLMHMVWGMEPMKVRHASTKKINKFTYHACRTSCSRATSRRHGATELLPTIYHTPYARCEYYVGKNCLERPMTRFRHFCPKCFPSSVRMSRARETIWSDKTTKCEHNRKFQNSNELWATLRNMLFPLRRACWW